MSDPYYCWTLPVADELPGSGLGSDDLVDLLDGELAKQHALMGDSRNDWLAYMIQKITTHFEIKGLEFHRSGHKTDGGWRYSFLDEAAIQRGASAVDRILALATEQTQTFEAIVNYGDILEGLQAASDQFVPFRDPVPGVDGEGARYFFTYLKWLRALMRWALNARLRLMHIRLEY